MLVTERHHQLRLENKNSFGEIKRFNEKTFLFVHQLKELKLKPIFRTILTTIMPITRIQS